MRRRRRYLAAATFTVGMLLCGLHALGGGNMEEGWWEPWGLNNRFWDERLQPIEWKLNPNDALGYTEEFLLPPILAGWRAWRTIPDVAAPRVFYGGVTEQTVPLLDDTNAVIFGDLDAILGMSPAIAATPCSVLTWRQTVTEESDSVDNGMGKLYLGSVPGSPYVIVPIGPWEPGAILRCHLLFNVLDYIFTTDHTPGTYDLREIAVHELGHFFGVAHTPLPDASMYHIVGTNPPGDGAEGKASLEPDDVASIAHMYKTDDFDAARGSISGRITLDGFPGGGVHVTALRVPDLLPVVGRISLSEIMNVTDPIDGDDAATHGGGYYVLEGLPPGDYYVYAEWYDETDEPVGGRLAMPNFSVFTSLVADGTPPEYKGELGFLPARFEFHNTRESGEGGDSAAPGSAVDNPDEAAVVHVEVSNPEVMVPNRARLMRVE